MSDPVFPSTKLGVFAYENPNIGTQIIAGQATLPCVIGTSYGALTTIQNEAVVRSVLLLDPLQNSPAIAIVGVGDDDNGLFNYILGTDYRLSSDNTSVDWLGTLIVPPVGLVGLAEDVTPVAPRTGLTAATYTYGLTAIRQIDAIAHTNGETTESIPVSVIVGGSNNAVQLTWTPSVNAQGYNIYRNGDLIATVPGGASNSFLDDGYASGVVVPPVVNTAINRPANNATYYVTYTAVITNYFVPTVFTSLSRLTAAHGYGSDLAIAGALILGGPGVGQGASQILTIAVPDETEASYLEALNILQSQSGDIIVVPLTGDTAVQMDTAEHVVAMTEPVAKKNRACVLGCARGTPIGDVNTANSIIWSGQRLVLNSAEGNPQGRLIWFVDQTSINYDVPVAAGVTSATDLDGWFYAAAVAGAIAALPKVCTPLTNTQIEGINSLGDNWDPGEIDMLDSNGIITTEDINGDITIYHGRTSDLYTVEHSEISIVRTSNYICLDLIKAFKPFWALNISETFIDSLEDATNDRFAIYQKNAIIAGYDSGSIEVLQGIAGNPTRVDVLVSAIPFYPANQIVFQFGLAQ